MEPAATADTAREAKLQIHKSMQGDVFFLRFVGVVDENFNGNTLADSLSGQLIISMAEIRRITSFGIRQWLEFVSRVSKTCNAIYFVECVPRIIDQLNMVNGFGGAGIVVSFYAPFRCEICGSERLQLVQLDRDGDKIRAMQLDGGVCATDQGKMVFDDDPYTFLSYVSNQAPFQLSPKVASFLAGRTQYTVPDEIRKVRVDKKVRDRYTFIAISGDISRDLPVEKISEGLEGDLVLDLTAVGRMTDEGVVLWRMLLQTIAPITERLLIVGMPPWMLEKLSRLHDLAEKGQVLSLYLPFFCSSCSITTLVEINVASCFETLRFATPPDMSCPDCGKVTSCAASEATLARLTELPMPAADLDDAKILSWAREVAKEAPPEPVHRVVAPPVAAVSRGWPFLAVLTAGALLGITVALYFLLDRNKRGSSEGSSPVVRLVASRSKPPAWRDQRFTDKGDHVLLVGSSSPTVDREDGFKQAKEAALDELSQRLALSVVEPLWVEHVGGQFQKVRAKATDDLEKALVAGEQDSIGPLWKRVVSRREKVAKTIVEGASAIFQAEHDQIYWEKLKVGDGIRYRVWALLRVEKNELRRLAAYYSRGEEALGTSVVPFFPGMAWRNDATRGAVVVWARPGSPLRSIGILPGDVILAVRDRAITDARSFRQVVNEERAGLERSGGILAFRVQRGDAPVMEHQLVVPKRTERPIYRPGVRVQPGGREMPPGNIWDDNPFE